MNKSNIISIICVVAILAFGYFVTYPVLTSINQNTLANKAKAQEVTDAQTKLNNLNSLKSEFAKYQEQVKLLSVAAPSTAEMPEILTQLNTIAAKSGMVLGSVQPTTAQNSGAVSVNVSASGNFGACQSFLSNLEKNVRIVTVKSMNLTSSSAGESDLITANFSLDFIQAQ